MGSTAAPQNGRRQPWCSPGVLDPLSSYPFAIAALSDTPFGDIFKGAPLRTPFGDIFRRVHHKGRRLGIFFFSNGVSLRTPKTLVDVPFRFCWVGFSERIRCQKMGSRVIVLSLEMQLGGHSRIVDFGHLNVLPFGIKDPLGARGSPGQHWGDSRVTLAWVVPTGSRSF